MSSTRGPAQERSAAGALREPVTADGWRIGILGAGQAGAKQALGFANQANCAVVGVADTAPGRAEALVSTVGGTPVRNVTELLRLGIDALVVATPHAFHVAPVRAAAERGVHVMLEKPIATNYADALQIVEMARDAGIRLATSFVHRFREEVQLAKAWSRRAGTIEVGRETISTRRTSEHPTWLTNAAIAGGGVLLYTAIHGVDRLRWLFNDEVTEVVARTRRYSTDDSEVEDGVAALITFERGGVATVTANSATYPNAPAVWETEIHGSEAMVRVRTRSFAETSGLHGSERYEPGHDVETREPDYNFERQAADFLAAVAEGRDPAVTGEDGMRALEACLAIYLSAAEGRPVAIAEVRETDRSTHG